MKIQIGYDILTKARSNKIGSILIKLIIGCLIITAVNIITFKMFIDNSVDVKAYFFNWICMDILSLT